MRILWLFSQTLGLALIFYGLYIMVVGETVLRGLGLLVVGLVALIASYRVAMGRS